MIKEFREFISRGNVMDLAVAVIIGAAFTAIVTSLVDDIIMPIVGVLLGGVDFTSLSVQVGDASIMYGNFIQSIINFLIIAFVIFLMVKALNEASRRVPGMEQEEEEEKEEEPDPEVVLLTEIRDLLKKQANGELS